jgi:hypothetical protein
MGTRAAGKPFRRLYIILVIGHYTGDQYRKLDDRIAGCPTLRDFRRVGFPRPRRAIPATSLLTSAIVSPVEERPFIAAFRASIRAKKGDEGAAARRAEARFVCTATERGHKWPLYHLALCPQHSRAKGPSASLRSGPRHTDYASSLTFAARS